SRLPRNWPAHWLLALEKATRAVKESPPKSAVRRYAPLGPSAAGTGAASRATASAASRRMGASFGSDRDGYCPPVTLILGVSPRNPPRRPEMGLAAAVNRRCQFIIHRRRIAPLRRIRRIGRIRSTGAKAAS